MKMFESGKFISSDSVLENAPEWGMSLKSAGSMRFRWNEKNPGRDRFLSSVAGTDHEIVCVELIHSKIVYAVSSASETYGLKGDGIITANKKLIPVVTAADCMPVFIYDPVTEVFGALHSGWKGTGIVAEAIKKAGEVYGSRAEDFCVVMAPHIHDCCYLVDKRRADYFAQNFTPECVSACSGTDGNSTLWRLSLAKANLSVLEKLGVKKQNIFVSSECTCCSEKFGSFRRETSLLSPDMAQEEKMKLFTVQACWLKW